MNDSVFYLFGLGFVLYYYFAVSWGLSFKQIFFHYLYALVLSLIYDFLHRNLSDISMMLFMVIILFILFYFLYLRKRVAFNEPINKRFLDAKTFIEEYFHHYAIESGFNYNGFFTKKIKQLKKGEVVVLSPVYSYLETKSKAYFLTNNYVILDLQTGVFSGYSDFERLSKEESDVFIDLENQKKDIMLELEKDRHV